MTPFDGSDSVRPVAKAKTNKAKRLPQAPMRDLSKMSTDERTGLLGKITGRPDRSRPNEELESLRLGLEIDATRAAWALLTLNRQIQPSFDAEAQKAVRVVGAVLGMFRERTLSRHQSKLLDRLFATLSGGDLDLNARTFLAAEEARAAIDAFAKMENDKDRRNVARHLAIGLTLGTDNGWAPLIEEEPKVMAALLLCMDSAGRDKIGEQGLLARLSRGLHVLDLPYRALEPGVAETIRKRLDRAQKQSQDEPVL